MNLGHEHLERLPGVWHNYCGDSLGERSQESRFACLWTKEHFKQRQIPRSSSTKLTTFCSRPNSLWRKALQQCRTRRAVALLNNNNRRGLSLLDNVLQRASLQPVFAASRRIFRNSRYGRQIMMRCHLRARH